MKTFSQAAFLAAAGRAADLPPQGPPEVAFAGRSNVGKSSAINALLDRKRLAYTSKRPGRTQTINFYQLGAAGRNPDESRFSDTGRSPALLERHATGCRRMSRPACRLAASRPRE